MLKPFGDEFAGNGFRMTEYEAPRHFVETGDEKLSLFRELPLAIRLEGYATLNFNNEGTVDFGCSIRGQDPFRRRAVRKDLILFLFSVQ